MGIRFQLALAGILFMPAFAWSEKLTECPSAFQTGIQKKTVNKINGLSAIASVEILANHADAVVLASEIAQTKSFNLLATSLKNNSDKKNSSISGAKVLQTCVYKNFVYVQTWVDDVSMQQAQAMKSDMNNSLANNPTPRSANTTSGSKESDSTSDIENLVKEMQRSHN